MSPGWRRVATRTRNLHTLLTDTQRALGEVATIIELDSSITDVVHDLKTTTSRFPALVIFGTSPSARARLLNALLGQKILPDDMPRGCRWLRIQFGSNTQVHLSLGNSEFELVEDLECNKTQWDTLPLQDLLRQNQTDLTTILEIELNNPCLKDGLKIIVPPDIDINPGPTSYKTLKTQHKDLYTKRDTILKNFRPIYLFAIDKMSKTDSIFFDNMSPRMITSQSDEDFWNTFNLYHMGKMASSQEGDNNMKSEGDKDIFEKEGPRECQREMAVLSGENCLDLHQIKEINPASQVLFILFSDCKVCESSVLCSDGTESTEYSYRSEELPESDQGLLRGFLRPLLMNREAKKGGQKMCVNKARRYDDQVAFMNELLDQWELMSPSASKHYVKSQYIIIDDVEILRTPEPNIHPSKPTAHLQSKAETLQRGYTDGVLKEIEGDKTIKSRSSLLNNVIKFSVECLQSYLLENCTKLSEVHVKIVQHLILASFTLARELQVLPTKIRFVATQEQQLYEHIMQKFTEGEKKQELVGLMQEVLQEMKNEVDNMDWSVDDLPCHQDRKFQISNSIFYSTNPRMSYELSNVTSLSDPSTISYPSNTPSYPSNTLSYPSNMLSDPSTNLSDPSSNLSDPTLRSDRNDNSSDAEEAEMYHSYHFEEFEIIQSNEESWSVSDFSRVLPNSSSIHIENESTRSTFCDSTRLSVKEASLDVQKTVLSQLSRKISVKLIKFVDCLKDAYFGTLQRCLESLEAGCRSSLPATRASQLCAQVRDAATTVDLTPVAAYSWLRSLLHAVYSLFNRLRIVGDDEDIACCVLSPTWRRSLAIQTVNSLSCTRLAKIISIQILERVSTVHERYQSALTTLESALVNRLHHSEDVRLAIRKKHAPNIARLCLQSTSMCDFLMYGLPELGRVIGAGQYGVVYSVKGTWAGHAAAVKCVVPADDRHCRELAMEFFYTRSIPAHPRVVRLLGSLWRGAGGVLLVVERRRRDLHAAVKRGLSFRSRMQVALDIVEGIRYLHSLGLVHRDIKMKNVLLDQYDRAALADLGFCACEALISGSVVGTPVHMAPDLHTSEYDASVDVYAFGILFWYLCAGSVKLPAAFEMFQNKDQLWNKVKRGLRPERLPEFSDECWAIMSQCWASDPAQRAHLGEIQPILQNILENAAKEDFVEGDGDIESEEESSDV